MDHRTISYKSILFLCVANSARSQIAEGLARDRYKETVLVQSAGSAPTRVNPLAVEVMLEIGLDNSRQLSKSIAAINPVGVDLVITLCKEEVCPVFFGPAKRLHWPRPDPDQHSEAMSMETRLDHFRKTRDELQIRLAQLDGTKG